MTRPDRTHLCIETIKANLTPDLLKKQYRDQYDKANPLYGHCYVASEALYHWLGASDRFHVYRGRDDKDVVHWWLVDIKTGEIVDVTADQYYSKGLKPPYEQGRRGTFLTREPSKRAKILMKRITDRQ